MIFDFIGVNAYNAWYGKSFRALWRRGCSPLSFPLQQDPVNGDGTVFRVSVDAFHTVVADFFRIQITAVTFSATDAFPVVYHTGMMESHSGSPPGMIIR